jgi:ADP-ribosylglycohydrolase/catechol 2,3-dioxygenase-like lactoylglutathione lyase family enzyme
MSPDTRLDSRLLSRARGAFLAAGCGDALGWPLETRGNRVGGTKDLSPQFRFIDWDRREGGGYAPHVRHVPAGTYSDDTQLIMAAARASLRGEQWWDHWVRLELPVWTLYELGGGGAVKRAAASWGKGVAPWSEDARPRDRERYFKAGANGVVMRILPHAVFGADDGSFDRVAVRIAADGVATHGHPRALLGALVGGYAMWRALRWDGKVGYGDLIEACLAEADDWSRLPDVAAYAPSWLPSADDTLDGDFVRSWERTIEEMVRLLLIAREAIGRGSIASDSDTYRELGLFDTEGGSGTRTAAGALYLASRYASRPPAGLLAAAFMRQTDSDTIACVAGALLGAVAGEDWVAPLAADLQDAPYIATLAEQVASRHELPTEEGWLTRDRRKLFAALERGGRAAEVTLPCFGRARVLSVERPSTQAQQELTTWWLKTELGPRIAISRSKKLRAETAKRDPVPEGASETTSPPARGPSEQDVRENDETRPRAEGGSHTVFVTIVVRDHKRAARFYNEVLGLEVRRSAETFSVLRPNLVLQQEDQAPAAAFQPLPRHHRGPFDARQLIVVTVPAARFKDRYAALAKQGLEISTVIRRPDGDRFRVLDPDGHVVEMRARWTPPPT